MLFEAGHLYDLACQPCLNSQPLSPLSKLSPLPPMSPMSPVSLSPLAQPPAFGTCLVRKEEDQESHILGIRMRGRQLSTITNKQTTKSNIQHSLGVQFPPMAATSLGSGRHVSWRTVVGNPRVDIMLSLSQICSTPKTSITDSTHNCSLFRQTALWGKKIFLWGFSNQNMVFTPAQKSYHEIGARVR